MIKPIRDVVIVRKIEADKTTKSGLFIATDTKEFVSGEVIACGDGVLTESGNVAPLKVVEGNVVIYGKSGAVDIEIDGEKYLMMREPNIIGIM